MVDVHPRPAAGRPTAAPGGPRGRRHAGRREREHREEVAGLLFVTPATLGIAVFVLLPMVLALLLGFTDADGFGNVRFTGAENYRRLLTDPLFWSSMRTTALYVVVFVPGVYVVALTMALLVNGALPARAFFRTAFFAPYAVSLVVVGLVWRYMLADSTGVVAQALRGLGVDDPPSFLGDPGWALWCVALISIWFFVGFYMIILLGGLQEIPTETLEAARLDGAGPWQTLWSVVLPMLRPTTFFVLVLTSIAGLAGLQAFDLIFVMTQGGPANSTSMGVFYIYQQAFKFNNVGYASAMATVYALALLALTAIAFRITRGGRFDHAD
ncbi:carbohydrate ABC transporter permease [Allostreptomyces psammosilenae]|uniref:Multiple sugar transport system permease protein n=1 Tax=Allostreptomyces psammosilenae TaxID=1892865 RepID=A0A852ZVC6_9ACTN|nr:sugar ABC transporter permease [Allostreptomyces psammosilenae]NYI04734.1 multiple sugar transport system permease protein [Allostreptomyces psammosilenae]